jgi:hypothetical protein
MRIEKKERYGSTWHTFVYSKFIQLFEGLLQNFRCDRPFWATCNSGRYVFPLKLAAWCTWEGLSRSTVLSHTSFFVKICSNVMTHSLPMDKLLGSKDDDAHHSISRCSCQPGEGESSAVCAAFYVCFCASTHTIHGAGNLPIILLVNISSDFIPKKNPYIPGIQYRCIFYIPTLPLPFELFLQGYLSRIAHQLVSFLRHQHLPSDHRPSCTSLTHFHTSSTQFGRLRPDSPWPTIRTRHAA